MTHRYTLDPMATVILVRHGRSTSNTAGVLAGRTPGVLLDDTGLEQARRTAERLAVIPLAAVVSSPLERTRQTTPEFERRLEELNAAVDGTGAALTDFDELTVRQLVSNIKVLDRDSLLIRFKDGTELVRQKG